MGKEKRVLRVLALSLAGIFLLLLLWGLSRHTQDNALAKILTAPGMWMQNFTTNEPDDSMIECAIRSLELVLPSEKGKDAW